MGLDMLDELVAQRDREVLRQAQDRVATLEEIEQRGQERLGNCMDALGKMRETFDRVQEQSRDNAEKAGQDLAVTRSRLLKAPEVDARFQIEGRPAAIAAAGLTAVLQPYYVRIYNSDGTVYYSNYTIGNVDVWDEARGSGSGLFGTGAASIDVKVDWWFHFVAPQNRNYSYYAVSPMHGFYQDYADDGFWDSKEAHVRLDISVTGYQYNWKPGVNNNVFDYDSQNINLNDRFDNAPVVYYSDLLGADGAYLLETQSLYAYARGGGSHAELNFSDGDANYIAPPTVYVY